MINLSGHPRVTLFDNALVFGANLVLCIILVPRYGMAGAATSTLVALCSVTLLQVGQVARLFRIHPFRDDQLRCLAAGLVAALVTAALTLLPWPSSLLEVVVGGAGLPRRLRSGHRGARRPRGDARTARACRARGCLRRGPDLIERTGGWASYPPHSKG